MTDLLQILGAIAILVAFVAVQLGRTEPSSYPSLVLNLVGSAILAYLALIDEQWGFLLLEGCWAIISAWGLAQRALGRTPPASSAA